MCPTFFQDTEFRCQVHGDKHPSHSIQRQLERHLLSITCITVMVYRAFCIIASAGQGQTNGTPNEPEQDEYILLAGK